MLHLFLIMDAGQEREEEFKIKFDPNEIVEIRNVGELIKSIEKKIKS